MAYVIFANDASGVPGTISGICADDTALSKVIPSSSAYKVISITDDEFNNIKYRVKRADSYNGDDIVWHDTAPTEVPPGSENSPGYMQEDIQDQIDNSIDAINKWVANYPDNPEVSTWNTYKTQLESTDISGWTYPTQTSIEKYYADNGQTSLNILQLP
jgi:hypothetical protein